jgi:hypothetical protein
MDWVARPDPYQGENEKVRYETGCGASRPYHTHKRRQRARR